MKKSKRHNIYHWVKNRFTSPEKPNIIGIAFSGSIRGKLVGTKGIISTNQKPEFIIIDDPGYGGATDKQKDYFNEMIKKRLHINCPNKVMVTPKMVIPEILDHKCHICDTPTDWQCQRCEEPVCEDCTVPFTQMNQVDYTLCNKCNER